MHTRKSTLWSKWIGAGALGLAAVSGCNRGQEPRQAPAAVKPSGTPRAAATASGPKAGAHTPAAPFPAHKPAAPKKAPNPSKAGSPRKPLPIPTRMLGTAEGRVQVERQLKPVIVAALRKNPDLKGAVINVIVAGKHVILTGTVKTQAQMDAAGATVAKTVSGADIRNHIQVDPRTGTPQLTVR